MKRKILCVILAMIMLMNCNVFLPKVKASSFSDVPDNHWAIGYINAMKNSNIINGYEDGTFKPEQEVTVGEFIKMVAMTCYPEYEYVAPEDGSHWSRPYVESLDKVILKANNYNDQIVARVITRAEAAELVCQLHMVLNISNTDYVKLDKDEKFVSQFKDEAEITDTNTRIRIDNCVRFGLINGFEDGTFRPNDGLTRAQAAKIIFTAKYN